MPGITVVSKHLPLVPYKGILFVTVAATTAVKPYPDGRLASVIGGFPPRKIPTPRIGILH